MNENKARGLRRAAGLGPLLPGYGLEVLENGCVQVRRPDRPYGWANIQPAPTLLDVSVRHLHGPTVQEAFASDDLAGAAAFVIEHL